MKRIVTMQDISCMGKCSLTVALPIISAMGVETAVLPTAVLSTHTAFKGFTFRDLTSDIEPIISHWQKENFTFDAIYTGYLGSFEQLKIAEHLFDTFGNGQPIIVDPCMADNGKLYSGFTTEFASAMRDLCSKASIICPNLTEASFLLDIPYVGYTYDEAYIQDILKRLTALGCKKAVLTGVSFNDSELGIYAYDSEKDQYYSYYLSKFETSFHGTGDIWASTLCGAMALGRRYEEALEIATDYVHECMAVTLDDPDHVSYGVNFEQAIPYLVKRLMYR